MSTLTKIVHVTTFTLWLASGNVIVSNAHAEQTRSSAGTQKSQQSARDIPQADKDEARSRYREGTKHLRQLNFSGAEREYLTALNYWSHPMILYQLAQARKQQGKLVKAYLDLLRALEYGAKPFERDTYQEVRELERELRSKLARLIVVCAQFGTDVAIDGQSVGTIGSAAGQNAIEHYVLPGEHSIEARKGEYEKVVQRIEVDPGSDTTVNLRLFTTAQLTGTTRYSPRAVPWGIVASGLLIGGWGFLEYIRAHDDRQRLDDELNTSCASGCTSEHEAFPEVALGDFHRHLVRAQVAFSLAGTVTLAGLVFAYLNRPRTFRIDRSTESVRFTTRPLLMPQGAGLNMRVSF